MLQKGSGHLILDEPFPVEEMKPHYDWLTCFEPEDHLDNLIDKIIELLSNNPLTKEMTATKYIHPPSKYIMPNDIKFY